MALQRLQIENFRNHDSFSVDFDADITIFTGENGIGKTSLLEAISVLGTSRSFRTTTNQDLIRHGAVSGQLHASVDNHDLDHAITIEILPKSKKISVNSKRVNRRRQILEILPSVIFSPGDHRIIENDASERRSFLDRAISNIDFDYADTLSQYRRVVTQRNKLLKNLIGGSHEIIESQLAPWDAQLLDFGLQMISRRRQYIADFTPIIQAQYQKISGKNHELSVRYLPLGKAEILDDNLGKVGDYFGDKLATNRQLDLIKGTSSVGPHKDELVFLLNDQKLKAFGSQGERRSAALALRLGEVELFRQIRKTDPILLLDDVSSELDSTRRKALVNLLRATKTQVMITATELPVDIVADLSFSHFDLNKNQRVQ